MTNDTAALITQTTASSVEQAMQMFLRGGAPLIAFVGALVFGILLQIWPRFDNRWVAPVEFLFGGVVMALLGSHLMPDTLAAEPWRKHVAAGLIGMVFGGASVVVRTLVVFRFIPKKAFRPHNLNSDFDTDHKPKEQTK